MELESITEVKLGSPVLTEATVSKDKKKKRNFLFFWDDNLRLFTIIIVINYKNSSCQKIGINNKNKG